MSNNQASNKEASGVPSLVERLRAARTSSRTGTSTGTSTSTSDATVQQTDNDAAVSRLSAVELGYLADPFARTFIDESTEFVRRMPIINRGTYIRTTAIDRLIVRFLTRHANEQQVQIVSLGAGTDTRYFRLESLRQSSLRPTIIYREFDFPATTAKKIQSIRRSPDLLSLLQNPHIDEGASTLYGLSYDIHGVDLRDVKPDTSPCELGKLFSLSQLWPTLILSECCLTYLPTETSTALLEKFVKFFDTDTAAKVEVSVILYEPIQPDDPFGRTMTANLASRGISLPGMLAYPTIPSHIQRLKEAGFSTAEGWTTAQIWDDAEWTSSDEKERLRGLEMVDEEEEWVLLAGHYAVIHGVRPGRG